MDSRNPDELITDVKEEQQTRGELATEALQWFLDGNIGELFPRSNVVDRLSGELDITNSQANTAISDTVGDIVDPVQQIVKGNKKYVGVIDYKIFNDEGAYGYVDFDDLKGERKRVVCAKCVEDCTYDSNVKRATQGEGTSNVDATWQQLLNKVTSHYTTSHTKSPSEINPGASLNNGTTISGNTAFHKGNDGTGSGLNADSLRGKGPGQLSGSTRSNMESFLNNMNTIASSAGEMQDVINKGLMTNVAASQTAMQEVANSQTAMQEVTASKTVMPKVAASQTAMQEIANSQTAMQEIANSQTAMQEVANSQTAMQEVRVSQTAMQEVAASQTARTKIEKNDFAVRAIICGTTSQDPTTFADADAISQDATAMQEIANSQATMNTIAASETAMQVIASSQTAMQEIGNSQTAMQEVANSQTAINEIGSNANADITENTVLNSSTATTEFVNSNLKQTFTANFSSASNASLLGSPTNSRVLVTSNNNSGDKSTGLNFANDVGPETQADTTFIANDVNVNNGGGNRSGSISMKGIEIN